MREYELYLPTQHNDGTPVDPVLIQDIKTKMSAAFGGYTHLKHRNEGAWRIGGTTFYDEVPKQPTKGSVGGETNAAS